MKRVALIGLILALSALAVFSTVEGFRLRDDLARANARADLARAQAKDLGALLRKTQSGSILEKQRTQKRFERQLARRQPCPRNQKPVVWVIPRVARVGERVAIAGDCFLTGPWRFIDHLNPPPAPAITASIGADGVAGGRDVGSSENPEVCELHAYPEGFFDIDEQGRMSGWFIVPAQGNCSQQRRKDYSHPVVPGRYFVEFSYHLTAGRFTVVDG